MGAQSVLALAAVAGLALLPAQAGAAGTSVIAPGVSVDGVDLSSLSVDAASQKLLDVLVPQLNRRLVIAVAGHEFHFSPGQAKLAVDGPATARRAYQAGLAANGTPMPVPLIVSHDHQAVARFASRLADRVDVRPQNATVRIGATHLHVSHSRTGRALDVGALARRMDAAIDDPASNRTFSEHLAVTHPTIAARQAIERYATVITVDRPHFRLRLFKHLREAASYPIAVGMVGLETPTGIYHVQEREVDPAWHVPNAPWAGALAGQTIPPGPGDPLVARWLGLGGGVGIHGTNEPFSIGSRASHGCIRMLVPDVIALYPRVPLGTTVYIQ